MPEPKQRGEERGGAVSLVIVGHHRRAPSLLQRQAGLGPRACLRRPKTSHGPPHRKFDRAARPCRTRGRTLPIDPATIRTQAVRTRLTQSARPDDFARPDRAGDWIVPLGACAPSCEPTNSRPCQRCNGAIVWLIKKAQHVPVRWPNVQNSGMLSTETAPQCVNSKLRYLPCQIRSQNRSR